MAADARGHLQQIPPQEEHQLLLQTQPPTLLKALFCSQTAKYTPNLQHGKGFLHREENCFVYVSQKLIACASAATE
ncbi:Galactose oxidase/kelch repeat superfamily protein [Prunus dulcis]|uniref:Galactose oxidase/kelch repeat superfamily protein n=1 Tax=Prunus dulcis TaxID=3755 RepID=A0A4Y1S1V2_PRUDU|nr:Galactose oxidase/kelch repeat superfamily protein [Prunus dulcis]